MFVSILTSGHISEEAITSTVKGAKGIAIPEYTVLKILMRTEYRFFSENSGFVTNLFHFEDDWEQPNNFLIPDILFWLCENRKKPGQIGNEGYFSVDHVADVLQLRGYVRNDVVAACSWLLRKQLIEADHMNYSHVELDDCVKVTAAGFIHIRILCERMEYVYGVLGVTPIVEQAVVERIADYINRENQSDHLGPYQQIRCIDEFLNYLKQQHSKLAAAYPEFGGDRTGATFIIDQVEGVVNHYRNPDASRSREPNLLDLIG